MTDVNSLPLREAMGLRHGACVRANHAPLALHSDLRLLKPTDLAEIVEGKQECFSKRYAAGLLLGLVGDPRIRPSDPTMLTIPGGTFHQGTAIRSIGKVVRRWANVGVTRDFIMKECPVHTVTISGFKMGKYLVTNCEYLQFVSEQASVTLPSSWELGIYPEERSNQPVYSVSPEAADAYADWLRMKTGRSFRLATEVEWEFAASGGKGLSFPWGNEFDSDKANTVETGPLRATPVGLYPEGASRFGILDMAGNVEEYVSDVYAPYPGGTFIRDDLARSGSYRVARGGSFTRYGDLARCQRRHGRFESALYPIGFRLVEDF